MSSRDKLQKNIISLSLSKIAIFVFKYLTAYKASSGRSLDNLSLRSQIEEVKLIQSWIVRLNLSLFGMVIGEREKIKGRLVKQE